MKKRILASFLTAVMLFGLLPTVSFAAEEPQQPLESQTQTVEPTDPAAPAEGNGEEKNDPAEPTEEPDGQDGLTGPSRAPMRAPGGGDTNENNAIYVSKDGSDDQGDGTEDKPYASLAKAAEVINNGTEDAYTVYVMTDLTSAACGRFYKSVTIEGNGHTVTRGNTFNQIQDTARSTYNPALIEVGGAATYLELNNITLDDNNITMGTDFTQQTTDGTYGNENKVQDAMVASYSVTGCTIKLNNTKLLNYGGMSAIRVTSKVELNIDKDSVISGGGTKGNPRDEYAGPAGAIWVQGPTVKMNGTIENMPGRAIFVDGGEVTVGGKILNITADTKNAWMGTSGTAVYVRNNSKLTLSSTALIDYDGVKKGGSSTIYIARDSELKTEAGSVIRNLPAGTHGITGSGTFYIDGEITGMKGSANAINFNDGVVKATIGPNANLHHNTTNYGTIYFQLGGTMDVYGKINDNTGTNRGGGIAQANNGTSTIINMYNGAEICRNSSVETGGGVMVSNGVFNMYGGTIADNYAQDEGGGVYVRRGGQFNMTGGTISGNSTGKFGGGVAFDASDWGPIPFIPYASLTGGTIVGNTAKVDGESNDLAISSTAYGKSNRYLKIGSGLTLGNPAVYFVTDTKTVTPNQMDVKLENASGDSINVLKTAATEKGWSETPLATFWTQRDGQSTLSVGGLEVNSTYPPIVYAIVLATNADGDSQSDGPLPKVYSTEYKDGTATFTIPEGSTNGYAVALVQPTTYYGTLTITADPSRLQQHEGDGNYTVTYTATFQPSTNLTNMPNYSSDKMTFEPNVDARFSNSTTPQITNTDNGTITWKFTATLPANKFEAGESLFTWGVVSDTVNGTQFTVPSNQAETKMVPLTYTVTFNPNGGTLNSPATVTVQSGGKVTQPADPSYSGYTFDGWYLGENKYDFNTPVTSNLDLVAHWTRNSTGGGGSGSSTYKLTYHANYGSDSTQYYNYKKNTEVTVKDYMFPEREGYVFAGWNTKANGKGTSYQPGDTFKMPGSSMNLYAIWEQGIPSPDDTGVSKWLNTVDHNAYLTGYPDGSFGPDRKMTRAEVAQMFYALLLDQNVAVTVSFSDVPAGAWYTKAVNTLASLGMITGYPDGTFGPDRPITRAEFTTIAMNFASLDTSGKNIFDDVHTSDWFYRWIVGAIKYGWIGGYPDGSFRPDSSITRTEVTCIVNNMLGRSADQRYVDRHPTQVRQFTDLTDSFWGYYQIMEATNSHNYSKNNSTESWTGLK